MAEERDAGRPIADEERTERARLEGHPAAQELAKGMTAKRGMAKAKIQSLAELFKKGRP